ncbi:MAG: DHH family phosphoesterase [Clostridioides sp.]|jgi:c-di-AMP phosphodiesterase-like protein|nr:DHH family phosphoesterase [Clostridioides sp.]
MENKTSHKIKIPEIYIYFSFICALSLLLLYFNNYIGLICFGISFGLFFHNWRHNLLRTKQWNEYIESLYLTADDTTKKAIVNLPIPLCVIEFDGTITWYNNKFHDMINIPVIFNKNIEDLIGDISLRKVLDEKEQMSEEVVYKDRNYTVLYNVVKEQKEKNPKYYMILYWMDNTDRLAIEKQYNEEKNAILLIQVDGYDQVLESAKEEKRSLITMEIEKVLAELEKQTSCALKRTARDKFIVIMNRCSLLKLQEEKFSMLDKIRSIDHGNVLPVTVSVGVGVEGDSQKQNLELATGALDLALGRGGDQAVVKTKDKFEFYGGKSKAVEKKTKVKSRLIGHALREIIKQSEEIYIMGHKYPDMDSIGSAIGLFDICKSQKKKAKIVLDNCNEAIGIYLDKLRGVEYFSNVFISKEEAIDNCSRDTLVIVVDTHRPNHTECEELLNISKRIVVIDHHRRGVEFINDSILLFHEIYVSSTSELVTELVQYIEEDINIHKLTAEGLLAGICLDTKNFSFKTGVRTFEAASYLRKSGADTVEVRQIFNSDVNDFLVRAQTIESTKIIDNRICIAYAKTETKNINVIIAQVADELLNIKEVEASFVLCKKDDMVFISSRSLGGINVHVMMEKLGGGGHIDIAGAQLRDVTLEEAYDKVEQIIIEYLEEEENESNITKRR